MPTLLFKNNAAGTLNSALTAGATTAALTAGHGNRFPLPAANEAFYATLQDGVNFEIVLVTARATDTITITRAQGGTTARAFPAGSSVECRITAESLAAAVQGPNTIASGALLGRTSAGVGTLEQILLGAVLTITGGVLSFSTLVSLGLATVGDVKARAGATVPAGWLLCGGQAVSRTTYSLLFAEIGTTYGVGDGSTTFNLPDYRGRALFGKDNMNGTSANRLTVGISGITGTTLGAVGGSESLTAHSHGITDPAHTHTLNNPAHSHGTTESPHTHGITDPGHNHEYITRNTTITVSAGGLGVNSNDQLIRTAIDFTGITVNAVYTGITVNNATTAVSANTATTGITINPSGAGSSQNIPPAAVVNYVIFAGA
jgi:microcystin-dependent protein